MTHELRTPLNGILDYTQILQGDSSITTELQHGLNVIEECGHHLLNLISDVLDLTKVGIGKLELYETDFNLPSLLNGVGKIIQIRAQDKGINFCLESAGELLPNTVHGDERRLRQILLNLLDNALNFTDQGCVTLKVNVNQNEPTSLPRRTFYFKIEDTGIGIAPENLASIFEPFEQVGEQESQTEGSGLGLTISQNVVELMGGQLYVSSQLNIGTQFWFELALPVVDYTVAQITQQSIIEVQENQTTQMVFPPATELKKLYELSLMADIDELNEQVTILAESDVSLKAFITQMQIFLKKYQVGQLSEWLEGVITNGQ